MTIIYKPFLIPKSIWEMEIILTYDYYKLNTLQTNQS